jgi:hypothetical protein
MIVPAGFGRFLYDAQGTAHSEMNQQPSVADSQQKILGPPADLDDFFADQALFKIGWNRPSQSRLPHHHPSHRLLKHMR